LLSGGAGINIFRINYLKRFHSHSEFIDSNFILNPLDKFSVFQNTTKLSPNFCGGISGILWYIKYLTESNLLDINCDEVIMPFKNYLLNRILDAIDEDNLDFFYGTCGILMLLMYYNTLTTTEIENVIKKIMSKEIKLKHNISTYFFKFKKDEDTYDIGMAHGLCALICIFSNYLHHSLNPEFVSNALNFIISNKNKSNEISLFPYSVAKQPKKNSNLNSRLAWCYGDLSIALAFWQAGKAFSNEEWKHEAIDILLHCANRKDLKENNVEDAGICHGTAGIAHVFNRFYKETGIKELDEARWYWLEQTLQMAKFDDGLAGYKAWQGKLGWQNNYGLLEGIAGIGLVLLGFLTDDIVDLDWDHCLLFS
jgi:hypothetical protein